MKLHIELDAHQTMRVISLAKTADVPAERVVGWAIDNYFKLPVRVDDQPLSGRSQRQHRPDHAA